MRTPDENAIHSISTRITSQSFKNHVAIYPLRNRQQQRTCRHTKQAEKKISFTKYSCDLQNMSPAERSTEVKLRGRSANERSKVEFKHVTRPVPTVQLEPPIFIQQNAAGLSKSGNVLTTLTDSKESMRT